jgi:hypothetical protein
VDFFISKSKLSKRKQADRLLDEEECMSQTMSLDEKLAISMEAVKLKQAGDIEGYFRVMKTAPILPYIAKVIKEKVGLEYVTNSGWNLSDVEAEFGLKW